MKNRILLENYYLPGELELNIGEFVTYDNDRRHHESLNNLTPAQRTDHSQTQGEHQTENHPTTTVRPLARIEIS